MQAMPGLPVKYFGGGWNCRHRWVAVVDDLAIALKIQESDLSYRPEDLRDDAGKHAPKFGLTKGEYVEEAKAAVKESSRIFKHTHNGDTQYNFIGRRGYVVVDANEMIRGYFHHAPENLNKVIEQRMKNKKNRWSKLL